MVTNLIIFLIPYLLCYRVPSVTTSQDVSSSTVSVTTYLMVLSSINDNIPCYIQFHQWQHQVNCGSRFRYFMCPMVSSSISHHILCGIKFHQWVCTLLYPTPSMTTYLVVSSSIRVESLRAHPAVVLVDSLHMRPPEPSLVFFNFLWSALSSGFQK